MTYVETRITPGYAPEHKRIDLAGSDPMVILERMREVSGEMRDFSSVELRRTRVGRVTGRIRDREGRVVYRIVKFRWNEKK